MRAEIDCLIELLDFISSNGIVRSNDFARIACRPGGTGVSGGRVRLDRLQELPQRVKFRDEAPVGLYGG